MEQCGIGGSGLAGVDSVVFKAQARPSGFLFLPIFCESGCGPLSNFSSTMPVFYHTTCHAEMDKTSETVNQL